MAASFLDPMSSSVPLPHLDLDLPPSFFSIVITNVNYAFSRGCSSVWGLPWKTSWEFISKASWNLDPVLRSDHRPFAPHRDKHLPINTAHPLYWPIEGFFWPQSILLLLSLPPWMLGGCGPGTCVQAQQWHLVISFHCRHCQWMFFFDHLTAAFIWAFGGVQNYVGTIDAMTGDHSFKVF